MTLKDTINNFSHKLHEGVNRATDAVEQTANFVLEHNPLQKEVSLMLQAARSLPTFDHPEPSRIDVQKIDEDLRRCGILPQLHIGLDDQSNLTVKVDKSYETDCFGYMHAPGFWDQVNHIVKHEAPGNNCIDENSRDSNHHTTCGVDTFTPAAKHVADTVSDKIGEFVKSVGVPVDPRA
jgi:hypothetical protein